MNKVLAIDVDLTVVDAVTPWKEWYQSLTGHELGDLSSENNDLETLMKQHSDPLEFWRKADLYDNLSAYPESIQYITKLKEEFDLDIVFVSACFPEHERSKRMFLQRNFKFDFGFISTSDKNFVRCDYFVDDYKLYCRQLKKYSQVYQIISPLNSSSDGEFPYLDWEGIYNCIKYTPYTNCCKSSGLLDG